MSSSDCNGVVYLKDFFEVGDEFGEAAGRSQPLPLRSAKAAAQVRGRGQLVWSNKVTSYTPCYCIEATKIPCTFFFFACSRCFPVLL